MKPNIFDYATSELSQDAFICWLAAWADPKQKDHDADLNGLGIRFIQSLLSKCGGTLTEIETIEVDRQWLKVDVTITINKSILICIEDKTTSRAHNNQLERYKTDVSDWVQEHGINAGYAIEEQYFIYLKTHPEGPEALKAVEQSGYTVYDRNDLTQLLTTAGFKNAIVNDFETRLSSQNQRYQGFKTEPIGTWSWFEWQGFYEALSKEGIVWTWFYVANPSGGFLCALLNWDTNKDGFPVYLQIEQGKLVYKISTHSDDVNLGERTRSDVRNQIHEMLMDAAKQKSEIKIRKPKRFGTGTYMTVAVVDKEDWLGADDILLDLPAVITKLKQHLSFLRDTIAH